MEIQAIKFRNPAYVNWLKQTTYPGVAILAITTGKLEGCWETILGNQLKNDCRDCNPAAFETMQDLGFDVFTDEVWLQAGELILNSEKITL